MLRVEFTAAAAVAVDIASVSRLELGLGE